MFNQIFNTIMSIDVNDVERVLNEIVSFMNTHSMNVSILFIVVVAIFAIVQLRNVVSFMRNK